VKNRESNGDSSGVVWPVQLSWLPCEGPLDFLFKTQLNLLTGMDLFADYLNVAMSDDKRYITGKGQGDVPQPSPRNNCDASVFAHFPSWIYQAWRPEDINSSCLNSVCTFPNTRTKNTDPIFVD